MANTPTPWTPPALESWNFTDCTLYSQYASNVYRTTTFNRYDLCEADDDAMYEYLKSGLTSDILNSTAVPTPEEASAWYQDNCFNFAFAPIPKSASQRIIAKMITWDKKDGDGRAGLGPVIRTCRSKLQSAMSIEGDADIAGVGVLASYGIQAGFTSLFFLRAVYEVAYKKILGDSPTRTKRRCSLNDSLVQSLSGFFWSAVLLCIATQIAALRTVVDATRLPNVSQKIDEWQKGASYSIDDYYFAALASGLSSWSVILAGYILPTKSSGQRWLIAAIMSLVGVIQVAIWGLFVKAYKYTFTSILVRASFSTIELLTYYDNQSYWVPVGIALPVTLLLALMVTLINMAYRKAHRDPFRWRPSGYFREMLGILAPIYWLATMWHAYYLLSQQRAYMFQEDQSGNPLAELSFGQILALTAWIPVVVDIVYTFCFGMKEGMELKNPPDLKVVPTARSDELDSGSELQGLNGGQPEERGPHRYMQA